MGGKGRRTAVLGDQGLHVGVVLLLEVPGVHGNDGDERQGDVEGDLAPEVGRAGGVGLARPPRGDERRSIVLGACTSKRRASARAIWDVAA